MAVQPFASVTIIVYDPAVSPVGSSALKPLLQEYLYGIVPPLTVISILPELLPLQVGLLTVPAIANAVAAPEIVTFVEVVQFFASVTITE